MGIATTTDQLRQFMDKIRASVISYDIYTAIVMAVYCVLALVFYPYVPNASSIILQDMLIGVTIMALIVAWVTTELPVFGFLRRFYVIPVIYLMYDQVHAFVRIVHPVDYDHLFIAIDRAIFGTDPTRWLARFSVPALTEYLQICYFLFYLLPIIQAVELWRKGDVDRLDVFARGMAFCYYISYLLYFALPAIGPRFTLHDFRMLDVDLPGILFTPLLRDLINVGGGVARGVIDAAGLVNRDCMPSGHTMMTLVNILLAFRFRSRFRWLFVVIGGSLILSTIYLRYHYVIDVLVGALLAVAILPIEPWVNTRLRRFLEGGCVWKKSGTSM